MGERSKNMGKLMSNPKQRNIFLLIAAIVVLTLVVGVYFATQDEAKSELPAGANVSAVPLVSAVPGTSTSPEYNAQVQQANETAAKNALQNNSSFLPTPTNLDGISTVSPIDLIDRQKEEARRLKEQEEKELADLERAQQEERAKVVVVETPPAPVVVEPVIIPTAQPQPVAKKPRFTQEDYAIIAALTTNGVSKAPSSEFNFVGQGGQNQSSNYDQNQNVAGTQNINSNNNNTQAVQLPLEKAGTIFNAILETSINSDEPSPIMAKIVSGPLAGSRLIGSTQLVGEKMVLQFSTLNMPSHPTSLAVSAVAIDPTTSRTALASDVNNHFFKKYGILLASSFLSGWSQAIRENNTISTVTPLGGVVSVPKDGLSSSDINKQALGNVGTEIGNSVRQSSQTIKPTVKVDSGIAIGILLMNDLSIKQ